MRYVIAYDISDDHRRNRVFKFLKNWGRRVQESVFECDLSKEELTEVTARLKEWMNASEDRCHIYRLCADCISHRFIIALGDIEPEWTRTIVV